MIQRRLTCSNLKRQNKYGGKEASTISDPANAEGLLNLNSQIMRYKSNFSDDEGDEEQEEDDN